MNMPCLIILFNKINCNCDLGCVGEEGAIHRQKKKPAEYVRCGRWGATHSRMAIRQSWLVLFLLHNGKDHT